MSSDRFRTAALLHFLKLFVALCAFAGHGASHAQSWTRIATEGASFTVSGTQTVRYGVNNAWVEKSVAATGACTNAFFGRDPAYGVVKQCELLKPIVQSSPAAATHPNHLTLWNHLQINLPNAMGLVSNQNPAKKIRVAVIDGGRTEHNDIGWAKNPDNSILAFDATREWACRAFAVTDPTFCARVPNNPMQGAGDPHKHGTHVMGIVNGNHASRGRFGVCPPSVCEILSIKADIGDGKFVATAIDLARENKADVINMSFNYPQHSGVACDDVKLKAATAGTGNLLDIKNALNNALNAGIVIVNSSGNHGTGTPNPDQAQLDSRHQFPAACEGVISVGATGQSGDITNYSNRGTQTGTAPNGRSISSMTLVAPGGDRENNNFFGAGIECTGMTETGTVGVYSTHYIDNPAKPCHRYLSGTSMAAPHVSAVVGLMIAERASASPAAPRLAPKDVKNILIQSATSTTSKPNCGQAPGYCGAGLLNAYEAILAARTYASTTPPASTGSGGPCSYAPAGTVCKLDALGYDTDTVNFKEETVVAYGRMWKFDAAGKTTTVAAKDLRTIPHYASGPCSRAPAGQPCVIDSLTILNHPAYGYIESVSAYGYTWAFTRNGTPIDWANNIFLNLVDRYRKEGSFGAGSASPVKPCQVSPYDACKFGTRTLVDMTPEYGFAVESITADGYYFLYDWAGNLISQDKLQTVARYANGPCAGLAANAICVFDSLDNKRVNGRVIETITAYGRYWEFDTTTAANTVPVGGSGGLISAIPRFK